jgi:hypothetical protein
MLGFEEVVLVTLRVEDMELFGTEISDDSHGGCLSLRSNCVYEFLCLSRVFNYPIPKKITDI